MNLLSIAWKSVRQRLVSSTLTALSVALGVMLMVIVLVGFGAVKTAFNQRSIAYHLIIGAKGSDLQLVLSSVFRIEPPIDNLPYMYLEEIRNHPHVEVAIPLGFGDFTRPQDGACPIVGTTNEYFLHEYTPGQFFQVEDQAGSRQMEGLYDAVIGSQVATTNHWKVGDTFTIVHANADSGKEHDEKFTVVSVLQQTGTPNDRSVFLNLEAIYILDGHQKPVDEVEKRLRDFYGTDPERLELALAQLNETRAKRRKGEETGDPEMGYGIDTPPAMKELTAIYIRMEDDSSVSKAFKLYNDINGTTRAMAVNPIQPIQRLMDGLVGNIEKGVIGLTGMIILVSGISIFVSIYNSMSDRRREIGIMRALGARRSTGFSIILAESSVLCVGGGVIGWLAGHAITIAAAPTFSKQFGLLVDGWAFSSYELVLFPVLLGLGALVGFLPAMAAYRTNVADALNS